MFRGLISVRHFWRDRTSATTAAVFAFGGLLLLSGAALIADETVIAVQSVAVTKILIPQDQPASGALVQKPFATPNDIAVDDVRALFITSNARAGAEGISIFQQDTNVLLAQTNVDQADCLPVVLPLNSTAPDGATSLDQGRICAPSPAGGLSTRNPLGITLNPGTAPPEAPEGSGESTGEGTGEGAEVTPPVMLYQVLQHSGLQWNAQRNGFDIATDKEAALLLEYDITDPVNPVLKNGFLLGPGAPQAAVNAGTGLVFAGNDEQTAPFVSVINPLYATGAAGTDPYGFIDLPQGDAIAGIGLPAGGAEGGTAGEAAGSAYAVTHTSGKIYAFDAGCASTSGDSCVQFHVDVNREPTPLFSDTPHMHNVAVGTLAVYATVNAIGPADLPDNDASLTQGESIVMMPLPAEEGTVDPATVTLTRIDLTNVNPHGVAVDDTRNLLYVTGERTGNVAVLDATTAAWRQTLPISITIPGCTPSTSVVPNVQGVQVDPTTGNAYVVDPAPQCSYESVSIVSPDSGLPLAVTDVAHNPVHPQLAGTPITLTAMTANAIGAVEYKWWEYDGTTWTVYQNWSTSNTCVWTPDEVNPNYRVGVWARYAGSTTDAPNNTQAMFSTEFPISGGSVVPLTVSSFTASATAPQAVGTPVTFTAASNVAAEYKFWLFDGATWTPQGTWSATNTFVWTPAAGNLNARVGVWARTVGSTNDAPDDAILSTASMAFPVGNALAVSTIVSDTRLPTHSNVTITFTTATTNAPGPLQYKYWLYDGEAWYVVQDWSTNASYAWTPDVANLNYRIGVWVRSVGSTTDAPETDTALYSMSAPIQAGGL